MKGIPVSDKGPGLYESMNLAGIEDNTLPEEERKQLHEDGDVAVERIPVKGHFPSNPIVNVSNSWSTTSDSPFLGE